jgi:hypothetical protein
MDVRAQSYRNRQNFAAEAVSNGLCNFQALETPAPKLLLAGVTKLSATPRVALVMVPRAYGTKGAFEAAIWHGDFDDEGGVASVDADGRFSHSD